MSLNDNRKTTRELRKQNLKKQSNNKKSPHHYDRPYAQPRSHLMLTGQGPEMSEKINLSQSENPSFFSLRNRYTYLILWSF